MSLEAKEEYWTPNIRIRTVCCYIRWYVPLRVPAVALPRPQRVIWSHYDGEDPTSSQSLHGQGEREQ